ncbi:hypothetical protein D3C87_1977930 [compost metagenome]
MLQWGECADLFAGHEVTVGGHQQNRSGNGRAQVEQAFGAVGDQDVEFDADQRVVDGAPLKFEPPGR